MAAFPSELKPCLTQGYGFGQPNNIGENKASGGLPSQALDFRTGPVNFNIGMVLSQERMKTFQAFYYTEINAGTDKFTMDLDSGNGIEQHIVMIVPGSVNFNGDRAPIWSIAFTVLAESTPFQEDPFQGNLSDIYSEYGLGMFDIFNQLEILALDDLPYGP